VVSDCSRRSCEPLGGNRALLNVVVSLGEALLVWGKMVVVLTVGASFRASGEPCYPPQIGPERNRIHERSFPLRLIQDWIDAKMV
jgi:hypothetical protein